MRIRTTLYFQSFLIEGDFFLGQLYIEKVKIRLAKHLFMVGTSDGFWVAQKLRFCLENTRMYKRKPATISAYTPSLWVIPKICRVNMRHPQFLGHFPFFKMPYDLCTTDYFFYQ